jgi:hypothetical protein
MNARRVDRVDDASRTMSMRKLAFFLIGASVMAGLWLAADALRARRPGQVIPIEMPLEPSGDSFLDRGPHDCGAPLGGWRCGPGLPDAVRSAAAQHA